MQKQKLGACVTFFPQPATILTSLDQQGSVNLMTASWVGIVSKTPPTMAVSVHKNRKTYANIKAAGEFVVNMAPAESVVATDYCGLASGHKVSKLENSGFSLDPAEQVQVPLLAESPLNLECRLVQEVVLGDYHLLLGEIVQVHAVAAAFAEPGKIDARCFNPLVYLGGIREYWNLGERQAPAYNVGKKLLQP